MVQNVLVDGGYTGDPFAAGVQSLLGASVEVVKRNEMHTFVVLWVVERSFAWLEKCTLEELRKKGGLKSPSSIMSALRLER